MYVHTQGFLFSVGPCVLVQTVVTFSGFVCTLPGGGHLVHVTCFSSIHKTLECVHH